MSVSRQGFAGEIELTNVSVKSSNGSPIAMHTLGIRREQVLIGQRGVFLEVFTFRNFGLDRVELPLEFTVAARFESMFAPTREARNAADAYL